MAVSPGTTKPILLWAPPRSVSTAFERAVGEHSRVEVFHEHFADPYYFGPDKFTAELPTAPAAATMQEALAASLLVRDSTYASQVAGLTSAHQRPVTFSKELTIYYQADKLPETTMAQFTHCFLMRRPEKVLRSFWRVAQEGAADKEGRSSSSSTYFNPDEVGFQELDALVDVVTVQLGQPLILVDADDLLADPAGILEAWCDAVGLPWEAGITSWEAGMPETWQKWPGWHDDAATSTGFAPRNKPPSAAETSANKAATTPDDPEEVTAAIVKAQPIYDRLYEKRLRAKPKKSWIGHGPVDWASRA